MAELRVRKRGHPVTKSNGCDSEQSYSSLPSCSFHCSELLSLQFT